LNIISNTGPEPETQDTPLRNLAELEQIVTDNLPSESKFVAAGTALKQIRDGKLYQPRTWEQYVRENWKISRQYAHCLMQAAQFSSSVVDKPKTVREACKRIKEKRSQQMPPSTSSEFRKFEKLVASWGQLDQEVLIKLLREVEKMVNGILNPETEKEAA
jgi:hypothetical protein